MRNWQLLILAIAIGVWILSSLIRSVEDRKVRRTRPKAEPDDSPSPERPRRNPSEIDRFLQEVQRRRQTVERRGEMATQDIPLAIPLEPAALTKPPPPASRRSPSRAEPARPTAERPTRRRPVEPAAVVIAELLSPSEAAPPSPWQEPAQVAHAPPLPSSPTTSTPAAEAKASVRKHVLNLLRNPQSVAAALMVREVLDRPLSQRRR